MIWNSVILMTIIDIFIVGCAGYALIVIIRHLGRLPTQGTRKSQVLAAVGLGLFALFYLTDAGVMHLFPWFMTARETMDIMTVLHLDFRWLVMLVIVACISIAFVSFTRNTARLTRKMKATEEALIRSEHRFRDFAELGSDWYWEMDEKMRFSFVSQNIVALGVEPKVFIGKTLEGIQHEGYHLENLEEELQALKARKPYLVERLATSIPDKWLRLSGKPLFSKDGAFLGFRGVTSDITSRMKFEEQDKVNRSYLLESTKAVPWEADITTWQFTYVGPQAEQLLGYPCEAWLKEEFWTNHLHPLDRKWVAEYCQEALRKSEHYEFEYRMIDSDGETVWFHDIVNVVRENGEPVALQGFLIEITERKREEELLRNLGARLINAQEDERCRIARELHDDFGQNLAVLTFELENFNNQLLNLKPAVIHSLDSQIKHSKEISSRLQLLSRQLHPSILEHVGLATAISNLCREFSDRYDIDIEMVHNGAVKQLSGDISLALYRVAQESLRNVIKHSGARSARVVLNQFQDALTLQISDTGIGFDPAANHDHGGLGLLSMRERLRAIDGEITISRMEPNGTLVGVRIPLRDQVSEAIADDDRKIA